jgi:hypothetical protein
MAIRLADSPTPFFWAHFIAETASDTTTGFIFGASRLIKATSSALTCVLASRHKNRRENNRISTYYPWTKLFFLWLSGSKTPEADQFISIKMNKFNQIVLKVPILTLCYVMFLKCFLNFDHFQNIFQIQQTDNLSALAYTNHLGKITLHPFK